jgi:putative DNA methylase
MNKSFIEVQFPVSKVSKESYKERKANNSQTLTGLGKWWGRKPLILVRATILGLLMPSSDNPEKDRDIFLKILTMDDKGMLQRKDKSISLGELYKRASLKLRTKYFSLDSTEDKPVFRIPLNAEQKEQLQKEVFLNMGYDERLKYCMRPEQLIGPSRETWIEINKHLGTQVSSLSELIEQLGEKQLGHRPVVGDAFCGGGSIPFEAARMGCDVYGSDLNPMATLLTWASINLVGGGKEIQEQIEKVKSEVYDAADKQITAWGIEHNEKGYRADSYLYCVETKCPSTGYWVPLAPSWIISEKKQVCAKLEPDHENKRYDIKIIIGADSSTYEKAEFGTIQGNEMVCPETGDRFPISTLRGDRWENGETVYGLRQWVNDDIVPRFDDVFQERLYCIRYVETIINSKGRKEYIRKYVEPNSEDIQRELKVVKILKGLFNEWQKKGFIPFKKIERGYNTDQPIRERGWTYWHHLFNPRQLLIHGLLLSLSASFDTRIFVGLLLGVCKLANWNSKLTFWDKSPANEKGSQTFSNQALNTLFNYSCRPLVSLDSVWFYNISKYNIDTNTFIKPNDARTVNFSCDFWITDPPYADAVNYHELGNFFLAWSEKQIEKLFPEWYIDSKAPLAVKGNEQGFRESMVDCYTNFTRNMPDDGAQVVMFTHQNSSVWADLALILWASGLQVIAAWTIQTETEAAGIKKGNYVQGTVIMVLRKQESEDIAFLSDIQVDVEFEVKEHLQNMIDLDDKEDPNFNDTDYQLAAYAAALRVLTSYKRIEDIDVQYELMKERTPEEKNEIEKIIDSAVAIACEYLVPKGFEPGIWRMLAPEERFYIKGLEIHSHGEYRNGVFQELARGFGIREYLQFLKSGKANETRLLTATEFATKGLHDDNFGKSLVRNILFAIRETLKDDSPESGRNWLYNELLDYWNVKQRIIHLLRFITKTTSSLDDWSEDAQAARLLTGYIENDHV